MKVLCEEKLLMSSLNTVIKNWRTACKMAVTGKFFSKQSLETKPPQFYKVSQ